jgi:PAS domain S-box-containing protein
MFVLVIIITTASVLLAAAGAFFFIRHRTAKKALTDLAVKLDNNESIIHLANDALLAIDIVDGKILRCNPAAATMLGYSISTLLNKTLFDLHPPEYLQKSSMTVADVWEKGGLVYQDIPFKSSSGALVPVECSAKVAPFAGRPAIVIYARDISERLRLEREIRDKNRIIEDKNNEILDSITYARRLQRSILPSREILEERLKDHFVFYKPKDIVSGDFYWCAEKEGIPFVAAIDCTGHGVPGAFMSMVGYTLLNQSLKSAGLDSPAAILDFLNHELPGTLKAQEEEGTIRDGMDMTLCAIDRKAGLLRYAAANNPVWVVRNKELIELKADKQAVTAGTDMVKKPFTDRSFALSNGDMIYLFTDGFADQFGGPKGKKFMYRKLSELIVSLSEESTTVQMKGLESALEAWKGTNEQVDDVCVVGIRI